MSPLVRKDNGVTETREDHGACVLAIVGSRDVHKSAGHTLIRKVIDEHRPIMVISGGARVNASNRMRGLISIDNDAIEIAKSLGIQTTEILPTAWTWDGVGGLKERNMKVADVCICLVRIASTTTKTYGSGWTADYAGRQGKNVQRYYITETGEIKEGNWNGEG